MPPRKIHDPVRRREYIREYNKVYLKEYRKSGEARRWKQARKRQAVEYLGGKCQRCGYSKHIAALQFHHRDPSTKEFQIATAFKLSLERIMQELEKCDLLCANCHAELHWEE